LDSQGRFAPPWQILCVGDGVEWVAGSIQVDRGPRP